MAHNRVPTEQRRHTDAPRSELRAAGHYDGARVYDNQGAGWWGSNRGSVETSAIRLLQDLEARRKIGRSAGQPDRDADIPDRGPAFGCDVQTASTKMAVSAMIARASARASALVRQSDETPRKERLDKGLCYDCGFPRGDDGNAARCRTCLDIAKDANRARAAIRDERVAAGLCGSCGEPRGDHPSRCPACVDFRKARERAMALERAKRKKEAQCDDD